ncbi:hypothetical protein BGL34_02365 [Fructilactobacillus lindneri]|uniref:Adapter protein MecA n=2 Tax=Fructilactobacillus lindneri TaxID=53444 RepID=A0A0R2JMF3_9LACO|nr:adaptor protein MecA [Fructilactobacillus lindneri]ANZ57990.1 hypothetical protein AYR60_04220 [Fructilactobacillus lindneri]ANZ59260.1 hypothetical protein AYR59_04220 [Fructilactobacillus lindneri]KRN78383.1 hypothetical protein IV52_GL001322 [Fructilactobacillus lindneri DSM 20690 = JCM 11027]POG98903.1 hypothetical protein BGL31_02955 [Fructilactobacillus lindneri]POH00160.1 hypothetical protein BGL33_06250 [Fructilactobacillus lindneri]
MKFEKTNENTIKVWVTKSDLKERDVNLLDLVDDQNKVENFFYKILEEVDVNHEFQNNDLVSFQVMPIENGFEMIISKDSDMVSRLTEANVNFTSDKTRKRFETLKEKNKPIDEFDENKMIRTVPIQFDNFENLVVAVKQIKNFQNLIGIHIVSDMYKKGNEYYLILKYVILAGNNNISSVLSLIDNQSALIYEYGKLSKIRANKISHEAKLIIKDAAISTLLSYFA